MIQVATLSSCPKCGQEENCALRAEFLRMDALVRRDPRLGVLSAEAWQKIVFCHIDHIDIGAEGT